MRRIAIIGSGQAGLILAHKLVRDGYEVEVYTDRSADEWLNQCRPTGTALLSPTTLDVERGLELDIWSDDMFACYGTVQKYKYNNIKDLITVRAVRNRGPSGAVDQRLKFHYWLAELERRGGKVIVEAVTVDRLDEIAASVDLVVVAAGKGELGNVIPRDPERSHFEKPPRRIAMAVVRGAGWKDEDIESASNFNLLEDVGEIFWIPFFHKTAGKTWAGVAEAVPGGKMDIFGHCKSGEEVVQCFRQVIDDLVPWEKPFVENIEYVSEDPMAWLVGQFVPTVRAGHGRLPSGRVVMPVGDTAITFDPIGGQGANVATRNAVFVADKIVERGEKPFDDVWMDDLNREFWETSAEYAYKYNHSLLRPDDSLKALMAIAAENKNVANEVIYRTINKPESLYPWLNSVEATKAEVSGW